MTKRQIRRIVQREIRRETARVLNTPVHSSCHVMDSESFLRSLQDTSAAVARALYAPTS